MKEESKLVQFTTETKGP